MLIYILKETRNLFFCITPQNHRLMFVFFFLSGFFFTDTDDSQYSRGREGAIFYSTLPLPPAHEHWDIYLQFCMWDDYHVSLIATLVFTRLLLVEICHLIELPFDWLIHDVCLFSCWIDFRYLLQWFWDGRPVDLNWHRPSHLCIASEPTNQVC